MALKKRGGLGSGMSSLFSSNEIEEKHSGGVLEVDINRFAITWSFTKAYISWNNALK